MRPAAQLVLPFEGHSFPRLRYMGELRACAWCGCQIIEGRGWTLGPVSEKCVRRLGT